MYLFNGYAFEIMKSEIITICWEFGINEILSLVKPSINFTIK